jgi:hypothetical protein
MMAVSALFLRLEPGWQWVPLAAGTVAVTAVGVSIDLPSGRRRRGRRGGGGLAGRGRGGDDGPAGAAAHRWRVLVAVSRLMPRSAGRRWLAEADSLLAETAPARPARRGGPQLPAVRAPAGGDDVGTRGPAAGAARPAAPGVTAVRCRGMQAPRRLPAVFQHVDQVDRRRFPMLRLIDQRPHQARLLAPARNSRSQQAPTTARQSTLQVS